MLGMGMTQTGLLPLRHNHDITMTFQRRKETFEEDALQQSDSRPLLNESLCEEDEDEVHAYSRDDMSDLVVEANNLNQPREFDGHGSENDSDHDDNESDVDATNNDAYSISEDDMA